MVTMMRFGLSTPCRRGNSFAFACLCIRITMHQEHKNTITQNKLKLECGPNVMAALPNTGGTLCSTPQFGWCPLLECCAVMLRRCDTRWNLLGYPNSQTELQTFRTQDLSFSRTKGPYGELSFPEPFVPGNFRSRGMKGPWNFRSRALSFAWTFVPGERRGKGYQ